MALASVKVSRVAKAEVKAIRIEGQTGLFVKKRRKSPAKKKK